MTAKEIMKFQKFRPEACVMKITPEIAKEMLSSSAGNRRLREWYVSLLAASMDRGEWRVTSQGIGFDSLGQLLDAHHRLNACVKSGISFDSVVVFGLRPDAYQVIDVGMKRTAGDLLNQPKDIADTLRLGTQYAVSNSKPTADQIVPFMEAGLLDAAETLNEFHRSRAKYFASAPIKLAACISVMNGEDPGYVMDQYKALCTLDFDSMSESAKALCRQVQSNKASANDSRETLARGLRVFKKSKRNITKIQISEGDTNDAVHLVKMVLLNEVAKAEKEFRGRMKTEGRTK
jgi:hypothetical protein